MRNKTETLTSEQTSTLAQYAPVVRFALEAGIVSDVYYVKRDGSVGRAQGQIVAMTDSSDSTASFKIDTDRGFRTVNTYSVTNYYDCNVGV